MLSNAIETHRGLEKSKDREWVHMLLAYLKSYVDGLSNQLLMDQPDKTAYVGKLVSEMRTASKELEEGEFATIRLLRNANTTADVLYHSHPMLLVSVSPNAATVDSEDTIKLQALITNNLPCVSVLSAPL